MIGVPTYLPHGLDAGEGGAQLDQRLGGAVGSLQARRLGVRVAEGMQMFPRQCLTAPLPLDSDDEAEGKAVGREASPCCPAA
jgi:hypothetical protein